MKCDWCTLISGSDVAAVRFYKGIVPLWGRQIPYTMMKFACFERTVEALYKYVVPKPRSQCSKPEQLVVTFIAGYIGMFTVILCRNTHEYVYCYGCRPNIVGMSKG